MKLSLPLLTLAALGSACTSTEAPSGGDQADALALEASAGSANGEPGGGDSERHNRPIIERDGRTLLWANDEEWFDVTDSMIDPHTFQFGIGKDAIPSIDAPEFVYFDDPRIAAAGITPETPVLGVVIQGEARAYPVDMMSRHEIVNDEFEGEPYAVMW